jgi:hypothetical protein
MLESTRSRGGVVLEVFRAFANPAAIADNAIVAAVTGKRIVVHSAIIVATGGANVATPKSAAAAIGPNLGFAANGGLVLPQNDEGWFSTVAGEAFNLALTAATAVGVEVGYSLQP